MVLLPDEAWGGEVGTVVSNMHLLGYLGQVG
jgi:hypothetical protein